MFIQSIIIYSFTGLSIADVSLSIILKTTIHVVALQTSWELSDERDYLSTILM